MDETKELNVGENTVEEKEPLDEILESVPAEHRETIKQMMFSSVHMGSISSPENVVSKKITEEHITQFLEGSKAEMEYSYTEKKHRKIFIFSSILLAMIFFIVVIFLLRGTPDIMEKIIYSVVGLVAGAFGGYGVGKNASNE